MDAVAWNHPQGQNAKPPPAETDGGLIYSQSALWVQRKSGSYDAPSFAHPQAGDKGGVYVADYTIANIPTLYRGRMYRSRLEARWAAFFDRLGWQYEYEPFDLGVWSPDFLLTDLNTLVEVKPITQFDEKTADKIAAAAGGEFVLLTVVAARRSHVGWLLGTADDGVTATWEPAAVMWRRMRDRPALYADLIAMCPEKKLGSVTDGGLYSAADVDWYPYTDYFDQLWSEACNAVQWEPTQ